MFLLKQDDENNGHQKSPAKGYWKKNSFEKPHHEENHPNNKLSCKISENNYVRLHAREHIPAYALT